jgi:hypothetical protein
VTAYRAGRLERAAQGFARVRETLVDNPAAQAETLAALANDRRQLRPARIRPPVNGVARVSTVYGKSSAIRSSTSGNAAGAICCSLLKYSAGL